MLCPSATVKGGPLLLFCPCCCVSVVASAQGCCRLDALLLLSYNKIKFKDFSVFEKCHNKIEKGILTGAARKQFSTEEILPTH